MATDTIKQRAREVQRYVGAADNNPHKSLITEEHLARARICQPIFSMADSGDDEEFPKAWKQSSGNQNLSRLLSHPSWVSLPSEVVAEDAESPQEVVDEVVTPPQDILLTRNKGHVSRETQTASEDDSTGVSREKGAEEHEFQDLDDDLDDLDVVQEEEEDLYADHNVMPRAADYVSVAPEHRHGNDALNHEGQSPFSSRRPSEDLEPRALFATSPSRQHVPHPHAHGQGSNWSLLKRGAMGALGMDPGASSSYSTGYGLFGPSNQQFSVPSLHSEDSGSEVTVLPRKDTQKLLVPCGFSEELASDAAAFQDPDEEEEDVQTKEAQTLPGRDIKQKGKRKDSFVFPFSAKDRAKFERMLSKQEKQQKEKDGKKEKENKKGKKTSEKSGETEKEENAVFTAEQRAKLMKTLEKLNKHDKKNVEDGKKDKRGGKRG